MAAVHPKPTTMPLATVAGAVADGVADAVADPVADPVADAVAVEPPARPARTDAASWFLRGGLAFVFVYAAATSLADPEAAATYFPRQIPTDLVVGVLLPAFAVYEVVLAVGLLTSRFAHATAVLAAATLAGIIVVNADAFDVLFRNVAIACAALALAAQSRPAGQPRPALKTSDHAATTPAGPDPGQTVLR